MPVGSGDYASTLIGEGSEEVGDESVNFQVVSNPEFFVGGAVYDSLFLDRIDNLRTGTLENMVSFRDGPNFEYVGCSESPVVHEPLPKDDPKQRCPDISCARLDARRGLESILGWFARRSRTHLI